MSTRQDSPDGQALKGENRDLALIKDALTRLAGINDVLKKMNETRNEWFLFSQYASKVLEAVRDIVPREGEPNRFTQSVGDLVVFINKLNAICSRFETNKNIKKILQSSQDAKELQTLQHELDNKVKLLQLNLDIEYRNVLIESLKSLNVDDLNTNISILQSEMSTSAQSNLQQSAFPILDSLPYASGASYNSSNTCMPGTRTALLSEITAWIQAPSSESCKIYWLTGLAGIGKTALANSVAIIAAEKGWLVSSFFFNRMSDERNKPARFVTTLARDLAGRNTGIADAIAVRLNYDVGLRTTPDIDRQFQELVIEPCKNWNRLEPAVFVVDALDEGFDESLLHLLTHRVNDLPSFFRVVITSRPLAEIILAFEHAEHITRKSLKTTDMQSEQDVQTYLHQRLTAVAIKRRLGQPWPSPSAVRALVQQSEGLFQWAFTVTEYLGKCMNTIRQLDLIISLQGIPSVASRMDQLYATVLDGTGGTDDEDFVTAYQMFMGSVLAAKEPLTMSAIRLLHGNTDIDPVELLERMGSFVVGFDSEHQPIRILHLSLREYLMERATPPYRLSRTESSQHLAFLCVRVINDHMNETAGLSKPKQSSHTGSLISPISRKSMSDGLYYAISFWTRHLRDVRDPTPEFMSALELLLDERLQDLVSVTIALGAYKGLSDVRRWLQNRGPDGKQALLRISDDNWVSWFSWASEALRRNGRLEEACAAAEDGIAAAIGILDSGISNASLAEASDVTTPVPATAFRHTAEVAKLAVQHIQEISSTFSTERLASMTLCLDQLGIVLTTVGELEEAYQASNEAVQLRRVLINANPKAYSSQLAWSLGNLSEALARGGDIPNALMAIEEAVQLYKPLVEKDPRFTENLAWGLGTLSKRLAQVPGEHLGAKKALEAIQEAVELYRPLVSHHIEVYGQNLAWALGTLSQRLAETKRYSDALPAAQESVALLRDIADCKPETAITPDLALQLRNLASRYSDAGCSAEALETIEEAIKLYRLQCLRLPRRYNPELMRALHMKCTFLEVAGRRKEAPAPLRESIALLRDLEKRQPALYRTTLESYLQRLQELTVTVGSDDGETEETEAEHSHVEGE